MGNITTDLSTLTTISEKTLDKFGDKILYIICETIQEDVLDQKDVSEFNFFGLFNIYIKYDDSDKIRWRIIPTEKLEKAVGSTVKNKLNLLEDTLNETFSKKVMDVYKELC